MKVTVSSNYLFQLTHTGAINCYLVRLPALSTWHKGLSLESVRKLLAREPSLLAGGHGRVFNHPQATMERAMRVMERYLAKEERKQSHVA